MKKQDVDRLVAEMEELPPHAGWTFSYEYPGYFCYSHPKVPYTVFFTPDWDRESFFTIVTLPIEVQDNEGRCNTEHSSDISITPDQLVGSKLLDLVRPTLDKLLDLKESQWIDVHVKLSTQEISALQDAREHVRVHMAHQHTWEIRDAALEGIDKVLAAARVTSSAR